jgi:hypothetical protein
MSRTKVPITQTKCNTGQPTRAKGKLCCTCFFFVVQFYKNCFLNVFFWTAQKVEQFKDIFCTKEGEEIDERREKEQVPLVSQQIRIFCFLNF